MMGLGLNRWLFLFGCVLTTSLALGACGGDEDSDLDDPVGGSGAEGGEDASGGKGGSASPGGGTTTAGTTGGGTAGNGGGDAGGEAGSTSAGSGGDGTVEPPESCTNDAECAPAGMVCDPLPAVCVACLFDSQCPAGESCRDTGCSEIESCDTSLDCTDAGSATVCDANNGVCVQCLSANDCPANHDCTNNLCVSFKPCQNSLDCTAPQVCDAATDRCYDCVRDADCGSGRCVDHSCRLPCASDNACTSAGMLCNLSGGYCVSCLEDSDCPSVYHCSSGECVRDLCESGSKRCEGNAVATCREAGDGYSTQTCGSRQTCVADGESTACQDWVCTAGETECDAAAETLIDCAADGLTFEVEDDCDERGFICYQNTCQDLECVPSARYCEGETVRQCAADGESSSLYETCLTGQFCSDETAACTAQVCVPNEPWCNGTRAQVCNARGSGSTGTGTDCLASDGQQCVSGACECLVSRDDCDGDDDNGCETNISTDPDACGACETVCSNNHIASRACNAGACSGACSTGYSDCNSDKLTDGCETNTSTDASHCGGCNVACSSANVASPHCSGGVCDSTCSANYADCNSDKRTDGCEINVETDPNHCGNCTSVCSSSNMATRTCSGSCNGTCVTGFLDCNDDKQTDGCETDGRIDEQHCGDCETVCADGESCVNGNCQTCNSTVLFLTDSVTTANTAIAAALETAGLSVTSVAGGAATYAGTPAASGFGAILIPVGDRIATTLPSAGQQAILTANAAGVGVVLTAWAQYNVINNYWDSMDALPLIAYIGYTSATTTYTVDTAYASHPIWAGLPASFTGATSHYVTYGTLVNGGVRIAACSGCSSSGTAVAIKDPTTAQGRVVDIAHSANYNASTWYTNTNMLRMFTNAAKWATRCE